MPVVAVEGLKVVLLLDQVGLVEAVPVEFNRMEFLGSLILAAAAAAEEEIPIEMEVQVVPVS